MICFFKEKTGLCQLLINKFTSQHPLKFQHIEGLICTASKKEYDHRPATLVLLKLQTKQCNFHIQVILQAEEGLKELDAGINELKKRIDKLQIDQPSVQELSKIQVWFIISILDLSILSPVISKECSFLLFIRPFRKRGLKAFKCV